MLQFFDKVINNQNDVVSSKASLWCDDETLAFADNQGEAECLLNTLTFKVSRNPGNLLAHVRRVYFCYQNSTSERLFAALLDLLIVLDGKGQAISQRLIHGSRSRVDRAQFVALKNALSQSRQLPNNRYSLFSSGLRGTPRLVDYQQQTQVQQDFLSLANDFIEYSQLEQAMNTLETGVRYSPQREDLQLALLELYQSTNNRVRFQTQYQNLSTEGVSLADEWRLLADWFDERAE
jgi:hypothetical protein